MNTIFKFRWLLLLAGGLAILTWWFCRRVAPPPPPSSCAGLKKEPLPNQYVLYLPDCDEGKKSNVENALKLGGTKGIQVLSCLCGNIYLVTAPDEVTLNESKGSAQTAIVQNSLGGVLGNNYALTFGPEGGIDTLALGTPDTVAVDTPDYNSNPAVVVAILDSGMKRDHSLLRMHLWNNPEESQGTFGVDNDSPRNCYLDDFHGVNVVSGQAVGYALTDEHGTNVAAIVAQMFPHTVAPARLDLMDVKFTDATSATLFHAVCGIHYAVQEGANVINMSFGYYADDPDPTLRKALEFARDHHVTAVTSAGNDEENNDNCHHWPSNFATMPGFENVLSVAALNGGETATVLAPYTNFGPGTVQLAAAGNWTNVFPPPSTTPVMGTSISAPFVTVAAACIRAEQPAISHLDLRNCILNVLSMPEPRIQTQGKLDAAGLQAKCGLSFSL